MPSPPKQVGLSAGHPQASPVRSMADGRSRGLKPFAGVLVRQAFLLRSMAQERAITHIMSYSRCRVFHLSPRRLGPASGEPPRQSAGPLPCRPPACGQVSPMLMHLQPPDHWPLKEGGNARQWLRFTSYNQPDCRCRYRTSTVPQTDFSWRFPVAHKRGHDAQADSHNRQR